MNKTDQLLHDVAVLNTKRAIARGDRTQTHSCILQMLALSKRELLITRDQLAATQEELSRAKEEITALRAEVSRMKTTISTWRQELARAVDGLFVVNKD
jgi:hypothetical protein